MTIVCALPGNEAMAHHLATILDAQQGHIESRRFPDGGFRFDPAPGTRFEQIGGDELLFEDGRTRGQPFLVFVSEPTRELGLRIIGQLVGEEIVPAALDLELALLDLGIHLGERGGALGAVRLGASRLGE